LAQNGRAWCHHLLPSLPCRRKRRRGREKKKERKEGYGLLTRIGESVRSAHPLYPTHKLVLPEGKKREGGKRKKRDEGGSIVQMTRNDTLSGHSSLERKEKRKKGEGSDLGSCRHGRIPVIQSTNAFSIWHSRGEEGEKKKGKEGERREGQNLSTRLEAVCCGIANRSCLTSCHS